jgi:hypothetical protein
MTEPALCGRHHNPLNRNGQQQKSPPIGGLFNTVSKSQLAQQAYPLNPKNPFESAVYS